MTTFTEILPPTVSAPHPDILWTPGITPGTGELVIQGCRSHTTYRVKDVPPPWCGQAVQLVKITPGTDREADGYDVFCAAGPGEVDRCDCRGFLRHGHCKHVEAVRA